MKKSVGTHQVESIVKSLSSSNKRTTKTRHIGLIRPVMRTKVLDAKTDISTRNLEGNFGRVYHTIPEKH